MQLSQLCMFVMIASAIKPTPAKNTQQPFGANHDNLC